MIDWYERSHELEPEQVFRLEGNSVVKLDHRKPGDGSAWIVATWHKGFLAGATYKACAPHWSYQEDTIEPGDLIERLPNNWEG